MKGALHPIVTFFHGAVHSETRGQILLMVVHILVANDGKRTHAHAHTHARARAYIYMRHLPMIQTGGHYVVPNG
jgi:hypothetical protein